MPALVAPFQIHFRRVSPSIETEQTAGSDLRVGLTLIYFVLVNWSPKPVHVRAHLQALVVSCCVFHGTPTLHPAPPSSTFEITDCDSKRLPCRTQTPCQARRRSKAPITGCAAPAWCWPRIWRSFFSKEMGGNIPPGNLSLIPMRNHVVPNRGRWTFHEFGEVTPQLGHFGRVCV